MKKIRRGLYEVHGLYCVATERLGTDKRLDWVAVTDLAEAERISHGNKPGEYCFVQNTLRALRREIERHHPAVVPSTQR